MTAFVKKGTTFLDTIKSIRKFIESIETDSRLKFIYGRVPDIVDNLQTSGFLPGYSQFIYIRLVRVTWPTQCNKQVIRLVEPLRRSNRDPRPSGSNSLSRRCCIANWGRQDPLAQGADELVRFPAKERRFSSSLFSSQVNSLLDRIWIIFDQEKTE